MISVDESNYRIEEADTEPRRTSRQKATHGEDDKVHSSRASEQKCLVPRHSSVTLLKHKHLPPIAVRAVALTLSLLGSVDAPVVALGLGDVRRVSSVTVLYRRGSWRNGLGLLGTLAWGS